MVVAMIAVRIMQPSVHEIIGMIAVRNSLMPAARTMRMAGASDLRRASRRVCSADRYDMLIDMVAVHMMQMAVMQIVDMAIVSNRGMPATRTMLMRMIGVLLFGAGRHHRASSVDC
jgi:hypothetical protein